MSQNVNPSGVSNSTPTMNNDGMGLNKDNHAVTKRLQKELMNLMMGTEKDISAFPDGDNIFKWIGTITGPPNSVYAGHKYRITLEFPHSYPYTPPLVKFITPCFHPNIDKTGAVCLDILKDKWSALYEVRTILLSIQALLGEPNNASPLNPQAASMYENIDEFKAFVDVFYETHKDA